MAGLGLGVLFAGYWLTYYGITQVHSGNYGFLDLGLPSRAGDLQNIPPDGPVLAEIPNSGLNAPGKKGKKK